MISINRNNYEEFFILYLDNELDASEQRAVEEFASAHPDLEEELEQLLQSKFTPDESIVFEGKEELLQLSLPVSGITSNNYEEWLVAYIDNELSAAQRLEVEHFANANPFVRAELNHYQQTKLVPETLVFPDKASLYRKEEKRRPVVFWRMAAAAAVLFAITTTAILVNNNQNEVGAGPAVAEAGKPKQNLAHDRDEQRKTTDVAVNFEVNGDKPVNSNEKTKVENSNETLASTNDEDKSKLGNTDRFNDQQLATNRNQQSNNPSLVRQERQVTNNSSITNQENALIARTTISAEQTIATGDNGLNSAQQAEQIKALTASVKTSATAQQQNSNKSPVTELSDDTYKQIDASSKENNDDIIYASQSSGKKNKLRGFFRKVTRTFEKKTNISATDEDDRLLVGGLAIRL